MWSIKKGIKQLLKIPEAAEADFLFGVDQEPQIGNEERTQLKGWALDPAGEPVHLLLKFDGQIIKESTCQVPRADVHAFHPQNPYSITAGFAIAMPMKLLHRVAAGKLELYARASKGEYKLWSWAGVTEEIRKSIEETRLQEAAEAGDHEVVSLGELGPAGVGELTAALFKNTIYPFRLPENYNKQLDNKPRKLNLVVDSKENSSHLESVLEKINAEVKKFAGEELLVSSLMILVDNNLAVSDTIKATLGKFSDLKQLNPVIVKRSDFSSWQSLLVKQAEDPRQHLVFWISDDADVSLLDFKALASTFITSPAIQVLMCTPYGNKSGIPGPPGIHLGDMRQSISTPLLYLGRELSPVWITDLKFLVDLEPPNLSELADFTDDRVFLPPADASFAYHYDLSQPILLKERANFYCSDDDAFLIRQVLLERFPLNFEAAPHKETFVFVTDGDDFEGEWGKSEGHIFIELAEALRSEGHKVVFVEDVGEWTGNSFRGFTPVPFYELSHELKGNADWIFALNAAAVRSAFAARYLLGGLVVNFSHEREVEKYADKAFEKYDLALMATKAEALKIDALNLSEKDLNAASFVQDLKKQYTTWCQKQGNDRSSKRKVSVIVPVYNALDAVTMCLRSLVRYCSKDFQVIIVNDASDYGTTKWLEEFVERFKDFTLINKQKNEGFISACYTGVEHADKENDIVLLNSDVVLTEKALELVQQAAYARPDIGLVSPLSTGSPHLQINLNPGDSLEKAASTIQSLHKPKFPTIITAEGQLLFIRRWALDRFGFFDRVFGRGFCEESDMCMRMFLHGVDMVCADNALIFHRRSASFSSETRSKHYRVNRPIFDARWGGYYRSVYGAFLSRDPIAGVKRLYHSTKAMLKPPEGPFAMEELEKRIEAKGVFDSSECKKIKKVKFLKDTEVVFILSRVLRGGGALSVLQHVNELNARGIKAKAIALKKPKSYDYPAQVGHAVMSVDQLFELDWSNQKVVATYWFTAYLVKELTQRYSGIDGFYYVQDYEPWFYPRPERFRTVQRAEQSYELGLKSVAKTEFLQKMLHDRHGVNCDLIAPGLARTVFYPGLQDEHVGRPRLTALFRAGTTRRGCNELIQIVRGLKQRLPEFQIKLFGDEEGLPEDLLQHVELLGPLSQEQVGRLYRESDMLLDMSHWHGFGRMGIESMACGAVPVLSRSGGVERYAKDGENSFLVDVGDSETAIERLICLAKDRERFLRMRASAVETSQRFSEGRAVYDWCRIWNLISMTETSRNSKELFWSNDYQTAAAAELKVVGQ